MQRGDTRNAESQRLLERMSAAEHSDCLFCGRMNPIGFKIAFCVVKPGMVRAKFSCGRLFQSYAATLHGGVTSALLDAAMTNALFSLGLAAVTGELTVRYIRQVVLEQEAEVFGVLEKNDHPIFRMTAELHQFGRRVARASARFVDKEWSAANIGRGAASTGK